MRILIINCRHYEIFINIDDISDTSVYESAHNQFDFGISWSKSSIKSVLFTRNEKLAKTIQKMLWVEILSNIEQQIELDDIIEKAIKTCKMRPEDVII